MRKECILVSGVGSTDPMRNDFDGPLMHITRHYSPKKVYLLLSKEMGQMEKEWHYNETAIKQLDENIEVIPCYTEIENPHSYDDLMSVFNKECENIVSENKDCQVLLNITSGTPQMETTLAMIGITRPDIYVSVQVATPEKRKNSMEPRTIFKPGRDSVKEWFENNLDNLQEAENRCTEPKLVNFRLPIIRFQIESLIQNYDYAGALELYKQNKGLFSEKLELLLEHGKKRLNLEFDEAQKLAVQLNLKKELYPSPRRDILELADYFNGMKIKKHQGEWNDFMLRIEVLTQYLALFILENCMKINIKTISTTWGKGKNKRTVLSKEKCVEKMPGIAEFLNKNYFFTEENRIYEWGNPLNSRVLVCFIAYLSQKEKFQKFKIHAEEMLRWAKLSSELRNPAAHTIVAITPDLIRNEYEGKSLDALCTQMEAVMRTAFGTEASAETFKVYDKLNQLCGENFT